MEYSFDEMALRVYNALMTMSGKELADLWNQEFGEGLTYVGDGMFVQEEKE